MSRDYRKEYDTYHKKPAQIKNRAARNKARRDSGLKKGDPREVDHIIPLIKGGGNGSKNTRVISKKKNREKGSTIMTTKKT